MAQDNADVGAILEALRDEVRARRQARGEDEAGAGSAIERELQRCAEQLEIMRVVSTHWPLEGRNLYQRAWALVNKLVRRYLRWYINPIVEQQNAFNDVAARTLRLLVEAHGDLRRQLAELEGEARSKRRPENIENREPLPEQTDRALAVAPETSTPDLQAIVEERARAEPPATFADLALRPLPAQLAARQAVNAHWLLAGRTPYERAWVLIHKLVRRYLRWLINPIVEQQNGFNAAVTTALPALLAADAEARATLAALRAQQQAERRRQL